MPTSGQPGNDLKLGLLQPRRKPVMGREQTPSVFVRHLCRRPPEREPALQNARTGTDCTGFRSSLRKPWPPQNAGLAHPGRTSGKPWDTTRNPLLSLLFLGLLSFRLAQRTLLSLLLNEPPRNVSVGPYINRRRRPVLQATAPVSAVLSTANRSVHCRLPPGGVWVSSSVDAGVQGVDLHDHVHKSPLQNSTAYGGTWFGASPLRENRAYRV